MLHVFIVARTLSSNVGIVWQSPDPATNGLKVEQLGKANLSSGSQTSQFLTAKEKKLDSKSVTN